jgi:hypothetical protein
MTTIEIVSAVSIVAFFAGAACMWGLFILACSRNDVLKDKKTSGYT